MDKYIFDTHGADSDLNGRSGQQVEIIRQLTKDEADDEVGKMFKIRFNDGFEADAFEDELSKVEWSRTDDDQWVKPLGNRNFELVEIRELPNGYVVAYGRFSPVEYTDEDIDDVLQGYGYKDQADVISQYGEDADQVIAECLFEQTSEMELGTLPVTATYEEAEKLAEEYMKEN